MRFDLRAAFAALALVLASCQGSGLDSGMGDMSPPVSQPGSINGSNATQPGEEQGEMNGPTISANGQAELANPGATLPPNEAQYPVGQGPSGMKCPNVLQYNQQYTCSLAFNVPTPAPASSGSSKPTPSPTPTATPTAQPSSDSDDSDDDDSASPSPTPPGTITMQVEPLPKDVPAMSNPDTRLMRITPLVAIRLQSDTDFHLSGGALAQYTLPAMQYAGRVFALQLYNETYLRGKRTDQILASYAKWTAPGSSTVQFTFNVPKVTVRHGQIWLLAMYGAQLPPGSTPTPSPTPAASPSPSSSASSSP